MESDNRTRLQGLLDECFPNISETKNHLESYEIFLKIKKMEEDYWIPPQKTELECTGGKALTKQL